MDVVLDLLGMWKVSVVNVFVFVVFDLSEMCVFVFSGVERVSRVVVVSVMSVGVWSFCCMSFFLFVVVDMGG